MCFKYAAVDYTVERMAHPTKGGGIFGYSDPRSVGSDTNILVKSLPFGTFSVSVEITDVRRIQFVYECCMNCLYLTQILYRYALFMRCLSVIVTISLYCAATGDSKPDQDLLATIIRDE